MKVLYVIIISELWFTCNFFVTKTVDKRHNQWKDCKIQSQTGAVVTQRKLKVTNTTYNRVRSGAYVIRAVPKGWNLVVENVFQIFCEKNDILLRVVVKYTCRVDGLQNAGIRRIL